VIWPGSVADRGHVDRAKPRRRGMIIDFQSQAAPGIFSPNHAPGVPRVTFCVVPFVPCFPGSCGSEYRHPASHVLDSECYVSCSVLMLCARQALTVPPAALLHIASSVTKLMEKGTTTWTGEPLAPNHCASSQQYTCSSVSSSVSRFKLAYSDAIPLEACSHSPLGTSALSIFGGNTVPQ
jgi:hypothetical protein